MKRYFSHAEISSECIANRGIMRALEAAAQAMDSVYLELIKRFKQDPNGRIVLSIGWDDKKEQVPVLNIRD